MCIKERRGVVGRKKRLKCDGNMKLRGARNVKLSRKRGARSRDLYFNSPGQLPQIRGRRTVNAGHLQHHTIKHLKQLAHSPIRVNPVACIFRLDQIGVNTALAEPKEVVR